MEDKLTTFNSLVSAYQDCVYRLCCSYVRNSEDRKDLMNDIWLRIWTGLESYKEKSALSTWVFRIATNTSIDFIRREKRHRRRSIGLHRDHLECADTGEDIEQRTIRSEQIEYLYSCIEQLPLLDKSLISLFLEDLSYSEIADIIGISESNVGVKLHWIKKRLNELLGEYAK